MILFFLPLSLTALIVACNVVMTGTSFVVVPLFSGGCGSVASYVDSETGDRSGGVAVGGRVVTGKWDMIVESMYT